MRTDKLSRQQRYILRQLHDTEPRRTGEVTAALYGVANVEAKRPSVSRAIRALVGRGLVHYTDTSGAYVLSEDGAELT